ncbi:hypothetical protein [Niabella sp.]|uniref:hypothetical protein n=1 Tax=Niabella sp. TaxID=1962976 RepID=UPI002606339E|nr:hypothetical protein [Niabella sp.]
MIKSGPAIVVWKPSRTTGTGNGKWMLKTGQSEIFGVIPQTGRAGDPVTGWPVVNNGYPSHTRGFACK